MINLPVVGLIPTFRTKHGGVNDNSLFRMEQKSVLIIQLCYQ
jgi:hypothetical protein